MAGGIRSSTSSLAIMIVTVSQLLLVSNVPVHATSRDQAEPVAESHQASLDNTITPAQRRGPWGRDGGFQFDDFKFRPGLDVLGIGAIRLWYGKNYIRGIQVQYWVTDRLVVHDSPRAFPTWGPRHGQSEGKGVDIPLQYPHEQIHTVRGFYDVRALTSIKFETNLGIYGPFGNQDGVSFTSDNTGTDSTKDTTILGIFGSSAENLDSLGVYTSAFVT